MLLAQSGDGAKKPLASPLGKRSRASTDNDSMNITKVGLKRQQEEAAAQLNCLSICSITCTPAAFLLTDVMSTSALFCQRQPRFSCECMHTAVFLVASSAASHIQLGKEPTRGNANIRPLHLQDSSVEGTGAASDGLTSGLKRCETSSPQKRAGSYTTTSSGSGRFDDPPPMNKPVCMEAGLFEVSIQDTCSCSIGLSHCCLPVPLGCIGPAVCLCH